MCVQPGTQAGPARAELLLGRRTGARVSLWTRSDRPASPQGSRGGPQRMQPQSGGRCWPVLHREASGTARLPHAHRVAAAAPAVGTLGDPITRGDKERSGGGCGGSGEAGRAAVRSWRPSQEVGAQEVGGGQAGHPGTPRLSPSWPSGSKASPEATGGEPGGLRSNPDGSAVFIYHLGVDPWPLRPGSRSDGLARVKEAAPRGARGTRRLDTRTCSGPGAPLNCLLSGEIDALIPGFPDDGLTGQLIRPISG